MKINSGNIRSIFCRILSLILCLCMITGCSTLQPIKPAGSQSFADQIKPGDKIKVTTRNGTVSEFTLKEATHQQLLGDTEQINLSDVADVERREFSTGKTVALIAVPVLILMVVIMSAVSTKSGGWEMSRVD